MVLLMYYAAKHGKEYFDSKKQKAVQKQHHQEQDDHLQQLMRPSERAENVPPPRPPHPSSNIPYVPVQHTETGPQLPPAYSRYPVHPEEQQAHPGQRQESHSGEWVQTPTFVIHEAESYEEEESLRQAASSRASSERRSARSSAEPELTHDVASVYEDELVHDDDGHEHVQYHEMTKELAAHPPHALSTGSTRSSSISYHGSDCNGMIESNRNSNVVEEFDPQPIQRQPTFPEVMRRPQHEAQQREQLDFYAQKKAQTDQEERDLLIALQTMNLDIMPESPVLLQLQQELRAPGSSNPTSPSPSSSSSTSSSALPPTQKMARKPAPRYALIPMQLQIQTPPHIQQQQQQQQQPVVLTDSGSATSRSKELLEQYGPGRRTGRAIRRLGLHV